MTTLLRVENIHNILVNIVLFSSGSLSELIAFRRLRKAYSEIVDEHVPRAWLKVLTIKQISKAFLHSDLYVVSHACEALLFRQQKIGKLPIEPEVMRFAFVDHFVTHNYRLSKDRSFDELFVKFGLVNCVDRQGETALHRAVIDNNFDRVKFLLANGANVEIGKSQALVLYATESNDFEIVKALVEAGANLNYIGKDGQSAIFEAKGQILEYLCKQPKINLDHIDFAGLTTVVRRLILHSHRFIGTTEKEIRLLVENGASFDPREAKVKSLHVAAEIAARGTNIFLKMLASFGAYFNVLDKNEYTPLLAYCFQVNGRKENYIPKTETEYENSRPKTKEDYDKLFSRTPAEHEKYFIPKTEAEYKEDLEIFFANGANIGYITPHGNTVFSAAASKFYLLKVLIDFAKILIPDHLVCLLNVEESFLATTPIQRAIEEATEPFLSVELLIENGAVPVESTFRNYDCVIKRIRRRKLRNLPIDNLDPKETEATILDIIDIPIKDDEDPTPTFERTMENKRLTSNRIFDRKFPARERDYLSKYFSVSNKHTGLEWKNALIRARIEHLSITK